MKCDHSHYKDGHHMVSTNTRQALESGEISYSGPFIENCDRCGENIRWARLVRVYTHKEYEAMKSERRSTK